MKLAAALTMCEAYAALSRPAQEHLRALAEAAPQAVVGLESEDVNREVHEWLLHTEQHARNEYDNELGTQARVTADAIRFAWPSVGVPLPGPSAAPVDPPEVGP